MLSDEQKRRRWLTVGEFIAAAGLIIAGVSLYLGWADRRDDEARQRAEQEEERQAESAQRSRIGLVATDADGGVLTFKGAACTLQSADVSFPQALDVPSQSTAPSYRIEAEWFDGPLLDALKPAKVEQGRLPVLIESRCVDADGDRIEHAIYEIPFRVDSALLTGKSIRLRGLVLREYVGSGDGQARLDTAWRALLPTKVPE